MKILLMNQFFWPDAAATSQLLTDLARGLAERGHQVYAISADGGYALQDASAPPPVNVHRIRSLPFGRGSVGRLLSYASFYVGSAIAGLRMPRPDLVITLTTPPLLSLLGTGLKAVRGSRHFIWEMDLYPDVAVDLGYFKPNGVLDRVVGWLADFSRKRADGILALGECMRERLIARRVPAGIIHVADNWADGQTIQPVPRPAAGPLTILYSGNLGLAHDVDTICSAMLALNDDDRFRFVFAGSGPQREALEQWAAIHQISNIEFRPYSKRASLGESLGAGDIGLVTQREACLGSVVPSKAYGLMAAARPMLFIGPRRSTPSRIIERFGAGWQVECGDGEGLVALLQALAANRLLVQNAGARARTAFLNHFDLPLGVARICGIVGAESQQTGSLEYSVNQVQHS